MANGTIASSPIVTKKITTSTISVPANDVATTTLTVNDSIYHMVKGFAVFNSERVAIVQCYFSADNKITVRVRCTSSAAVTCVIDVFYC